MSSNKANLRPPSFLWGFLHLQGGPYATFAGRDASRGLACQSFDPSMLTADLDGPLDPLDDLGREELENLANWEEMFTDKYLVVGRLMAEGDLDKVDGPGSKERR